MQNAVKSDGPQAPAMIVRTQLSSVFHTKYEMHLFVANSVDGVIQRLCGFLVVGSVDEHESTQPCAQAERARVLQTLLRQKCAPFRNILQQTCRDRLKSFRGIN